jgi:D-alanyl-D-alanine carboxypeptidase
MTNEKLTEQLTAIYNGDNSFNSKNGEKIFDELEYLKSLQKIYGDKVEFYTGGKNRILDNITKKPEDGKINLTEDEVYKMVKEAKKKDKNEQN